MATEKRIPVKNKDTGTTVYKTPELLKEKPEKYQRLPVEYDRNPKGKPHTPKLPGEDRRPGPPRLVKVPKPKPPKKVTKPIPPVPPAKVLEPQKAPLRDPIPGQNPMTSKQAALTTTWLKSQATQVKKLEKKPLEHSPEYWNMQFREHYIAFYSAFKREFNSLVSHDKALEEVEDRVASRIELLDEVSDSWSKTIRVLNPYPDWNDPESHLRWVAGMALEEKIKSQAKALGDLIKYSWTLDTALLDRILKKAWSKATPAEAQAFKGEQGNWTLRYEFLQRTKVEVDCLKALKRERLDGVLDGAAWLSAIQELLESQFGSQEFREFDINGMKIVVDDSTVDDDDIKKYVKYIDEASHRMKAKGFGKAWYGTIFIQCAGCGGVNYNNGGGVGGSYHIGKDTVRIYERPGPYLVELLAHELGHRLWFKGLSQGQRLKFEGLVKTFKKSRPEGFAGDIKPLIKSTRPQLDAIHKAHQDIKTVIKQVPKVVPTVAESSEYTTACLSSVMDLHVAYEVDLHKGVAATLLDGVYSMETKVNDHFAKYTPTTEWLTEADTLVDEFAARIRDCVQKIVKNHNTTYEAATEYLESYNSNENEVVPVSDYGKSNPDEAFAEVFAHYVMGKDMTRDQSESFKAVLTKQAGALNRILRVAGMPSFESDL